MALYTLCRGWFLVADNNSPSLKWNSAHLAQDLQAQHLPRKMKKANRFKSRVPRWHFLFLSCKVMNLLETRMSLCKKVWSVIIGWVEGGSLGTWGWAKGWRVTVFIYTVAHNTQIASLWIKHVAPRCLRRDGHLNILHGRENGFFTRLFMVKILYSFDYNKTSITLWVNGMGRWGRQSAAQCNNNRASALNEPRKRAVPVDISFLCRGAQIWRYASWGVIKKYICFYCALATELCLELV